MLIFDILAKIFGVKVNNKMNRLYSSIDYDTFFVGKSFGDIKTEVLWLGDLHVQSNYIVVGDPLTSIYDLDPFSRRVIPGLYSVKACISHMPQAGDRFAFVKLEFSTKPVIKWELAVTGKQDISDLQEDETYGFPVSAGLGCFCDKKTRDLYKEWSDEVNDSNLGINSYDELIAPEFKKNAKDMDDPKDIGDWLNFYLPTHPGYNIIMFNSGYGDGVYSCYWGICEDGEIGSLVIDFGVL